MIKKSLLKSAEVVTNDVSLGYNLYFNNALYSLECFKVGSSENELSDYCFLEDITEDEGMAEYFFYSMVKGKVFPVHIKDIINDYN